TAIVIHKTAADATVVACADVTNTPIPTASDQASSAPSSQPSDAAGASGSTTP
ncbi:MAG: hypothetical protein QOF49_1203, partial [Chloroflexota bacterium]|nr:hypothetical protein [Chloroflexota bacterium]